uniref:Calponin-homology (CH) domain-containing protein n=2 Tax=Caenorhabditis tropicalis TaxID=1561998 RepID=A0A1I7TQK7_9PELO
MKSIHISNEMIECFHICERERNFVKFFDCHKSLISDLTEFLSKVSINNTPHSFIVKNFGKLFCLLRKFDVYHPQLSTSGTYGLEEGPGIAICADIKNAITNRNWNHFFEKYQCVADYIIDAARNQKIVSICIELGDKCYPNFSSREKALENSDPTLKWVKPSETDNRNRGKHEYSKNSNEMLKTIPQPYRSNDCSRCSHKQTSFAPLSPTVSQFSSNHSSTSITRKDDRSIVLSRRQEPTPSHTFPSSNYVPYNNTSPNSGVMMNRSEGKDEKNHYFNPGVAIFGGPPGLDKNMRHQKEKVQDSYYQPIRSLPTPHQINSASQTMGPGDNQSISWQNQSPHTLNDNGYDSAQSKKESNNHRSDFGSLNTSSQPNFDSSKCDSVSGKRSRFENLHDEGMEKKISQNTNDYNSIYTERTSNSHPYAVDRSSNVPTMASGGHSIVHNSHDGSTDMRAPNGHNYDSISFEKQSSQNGRDIAQYDHRNSSSSIQEEYKNGGNIQQNDERSCSINSKISFKFDRNHYDSVNPATPTRSDLPYCSILVSSERSTSLSPHSLPENRETRNTSHMDTSFGRFNDTSVSEEQSLFENHYDEGADTPAVKIHDTNYTGEQFSCRDIIQQDSSKIPNSVPEEDVNRENIYLNNRSNSPIETEMPSNIPKKEYDSLKHLPQTQGEMNHSNCSPLVLEEYSTSFPEQSSTGSNNTQGTSLNGFSLCQETEDTLKRLDSSKKVDVTDGTLEDQVDDSQVDFESRQKKIDEQAALVDSIFNLKDLQRPAVEKQKSVDGTDDPAFSDFKADMSFVNLQTTEVLDKENQRIQELRDHEYDTLRPHSPAPEEVENDSFNAEFQEILEKQREELRQKREERKRKQEELEEELRQLRRESRERFKMFMNCIMLRQRFDQQENQWKEWIWDCSKNISTLRKYYSVFEEDFQFLIRKSKTLDGEDLIDFENEKTRFSRYVMKAFSALQDDFNTLKDIEQYYSDAVFLRVLQKCLADVGCLLLVIYETTESLDPSTFGTLGEKMMKLRVDLIYSTEKLRDICKDQNYEYSDVEFPEPPSKYDIQEVD